MAGQGAIESLRSFLGDNRQLGAVTKSVLGVESRYRL